MRSAIFEICNRIGIKVFCEGTYVCLSGPAFETSAEIRLFKSLGIDFVGMTVAPEAKLCREKSICYQPIALAVNFGAGMRKELLSHEKTLLQAEKMKTDVTRIIIECVRAKELYKKCRCGGT
ncbi:MAG: S-methyl-5'-thioadenosine phosphorylase, partial [Candidatus Thermoplasmatota archaeon]